MFKLLSDERELEISRSIFNSSEYNKIIKKNKEIKEKFADFIISNNPKSKKDIYLQLENVIESEIQVQALAQEIFYEEGFKDATIFYMESRAKNE